jgi:hypothetical protein
MPEFRSFWESTASNIFQTSQYYLPLCYEETLYNIRSNIGDAFIWVPVHDVDPHEDTAPENIPLLKYASVTSCDVDIFFQPTNTFYQKKDNQLPQKIWKRFCELCITINDCAKRL